MLTKRKIILAHVLTGAFTATVTALIVVARYEAHPRDLFVESEDNASGNVVSCVRDVAANTVIAREDLTVRRIKLMRMPANPCDCIYVAIGRKLKVAVKPGDCISPYDFGLMRNMFGDYPDKEPPRFFDLEGKGHWRLM